jgi:transposase
MGELAKVRMLNPAEQQQRIDALERQVGELQAVIAALRAELEQLTRRGKRQAAPFSKDTHVAAPKRAGRKPGQGPFHCRAAPPATALSEPPITVPVAETVCPRCGGELVEERVDFASVTDLPAQPTPQVRQYRVSVCRCRACGTPVRGQHPALAPDQYGATADRVGERLLGAGHVLHHAAGVPIRKVPGILALLTGASVTEGALVQDAQRRVAGPVGEAYTALRDAIPTAARVHTDDTGWRVGGTAAFLMAFESDTETVYQIRARHRNAEVREVIGDDFAGVLITDRGKSYDAETLATVAQQKCLAHLQRSISLVLATKWARGRSLGLALRRLLREAHTLWQTQQTAPVADYAAQVAALEARLTALVAPRTLPDPDNQRLLDQMRWHHTRGNVLRFLTDPRLEPTNNRAERALRPAVIARKVSQCSKNERGAATFAAFASVTRTIRQRGGALLDDLLTTFRTGRVPTAARLPP